MSRALSIPPDAAARMKMLVTTKTKSPCAGDEAPQELAEPRAATNADEKTAPAEPPSEPGSSNG